MGSGLTLARVAAVATVIHGVLKRALECSYTRPGREVQMWQLNTSDWQQNTLGTTYFLPPLASDLKVLLHSDLMSDEGPAPTNPMTTTRPAQFKPHKTASSTVCGKQPSEVHSGPDLSTFTATATVQKAINPTIGPQPMRNAERKEMGRRLARNEKERPKKSEAKYRRPKVGMTAASSVAGTRMQEAFSLPLRGTSASTPWERRPRQTSCSLAERRAMAPSTPPRPCP